MSSPRTTTQQRAKASKANYESSQGDGQPDPIPTIRVLTFACQAGGEH